MTDTGASSGTRGAVIGAIATVLAAAVGGIFLYLSTRDPESSPVPTSSAPASAAPSSSGVSLTIEDPKNGDDVHVYDDVRIRVKGIGTDRLVWLLIKFTDGNLVYPQGECDNVDDDLSVCGGAQFGDSGKNVGDLLNITAVLVDPQGHQAYKPFQSDGFPATAPPVRPQAISPTITVRRV